MSDKTRSIFEEVGTTQKQVAAPGGIDKGNAGARTQIRAWLMMLFALVAIMIAVGGLTRLTDSGLSITEWKPLNGAIPPTSVAAWEEEFTKYKEIPEYIEQNAGMTLAEFKVIYWWEWGHRQLGRFIGLVWAIGFAYFYVTRKIPTGWNGRLLLLGALGGLQGAVGWWMVSSGLKPGMLDVASYRLAIHLGLAFVIFGFLTWNILWRANSFRLTLSMCRTAQAERNPQSPHSLKTRALCNLCTGSQVTSCSCSGYLSQSACGPVQMLRSVSRPMPLLR